MKNSEVSQAIEEARKKGSFKLKIVLAPEADMLRVGYFLSMVKSGHLAVDIATENRLQAIIEGRCFPADDNRMFIADMTDEFHEHAFVPLLASAIQAIEATA